MKLLWLMNTHLDMDYLCISARSTLCYSLRNTLSWQTPWIRMYQDIQMHIYIVVYSLKHQGSTSVQRNTTQKASLFLSVFYLCKKNFKYMLGRIWPWSKAQVMNSRHGGLSFHIYIEMARNNISWNLSQSHSNHPSSPYDTFPLTSLLRPTVCLNFPTKNCTHKNNRFAADYKALL